MELTCAATALAWSGRKANVPFSILLRTTYPGYQRFFLPCYGELRFVGRRAKTRAGHFLRLDQNRKPRMKSLWHPGYGRRQKARKREEDPLWRLGNDVIHFHDPLLMYCGIKLYKVEYQKHFQAKGAVHLHLCAKYTLILCCHFLNKSSSLVIKSPFYKKREFLSPSVQLALSSPTSEEPERSPRSATRLCRYICKQFLLAVLELTEAPGRL